MSHSNNPWGPESQDTNPSWSDQPSYGQQDAYGQQHAYGQQQPSSGGQQGYGQQPSTNQAAAPQGGYSSSQQSGWDNPQQAGWDAQSSAYGQSYSPSPYQSYAPYYGTPPANAGPGRTALILAGAALGISLILSIVGGLAYQRLFRATGGTDIDTDNPPPGTEGDLMVAGLTVLGQVVPTILGIIALVLAGRAMGVPGSKGTGTTALITAIAAPVISFIVWFICIAPGLN